MSKGSTRVFTWPWAFYAQLIMVAPVLLAGWVQFQTPRAPGVGGGALLLAALSVGLSVALSRNPHFSFEAALYLWAGLAFMWWLAHRFAEVLPSEERFRRLARVAGLGLAAPVLSSIGQWASGIAPTLGGAGSLAEAWRLIGDARNQAPFGHPNYTGGYALLVVPWFASLARIERGAWRRGWMVAALLGVGLLFSSGSRGALLGALALVATLLALALRTGRIKGRMALGLFASGVVGVGLLGATNTRIRTLLTEPSALRQPNVGDIQRLAMLEGGWLLGRERPWVGHGPGMVPFVYPEVRARLVGGVETSYQLHNAYLHHWVTTGLAGIGAAVALGWAVFRGFRRWLRQPPGPARTFAMNSAAALAGYAVMAVTDYQLDVIGIVGALCLPAALLLAGASPADGNETGAASGSEPAASTLASVNRQLGAAGKPAGIILVGGGIAAMVILFPHWRARQLHWSAWHETPATDRAALLTKLLAASNAAPWNTHYRNQLGFELARDALTSNDPAQRQVAREVLFSSLALDPAQEPVHANLAWLWLPDDPVKAGIEFSRALALIPDRDTLHHGLAISRLGQGDQEGAIEALALECLVNPLFITSPIWNQPDLASLCTPVLTRLNSLISESMRHPRMPHWRRSELTYFAAFLRWWMGGAAPTESELASSDRKQRSFFVAATSVGKWPAPWHELEPASSAHPEAKPHRTSGQSEAVHDGWTGRIAAGITDVADLVRCRSPVSRGVFPMAFERLHYLLMHRNLDGIGYLDLGTRLVDQFSQRYAEPLLPARGLIPGIVLQGLRDPSPGGTKK